ncbi:unnamed protein product [Pneumocystis jirovecii]|uniref:Ribosomal protein S16 n=2 Tax=Pneumocystis jirovecii TaxID=42068 RepID=L0PCN6_PNEJI|nr:ribosomal protein S16 [Pneumocystis jirovecii RU7]KTW29066.1 ribosomal protein S16 [Pneumocystis jirovecii RU7]CCJ29859.1 unnamed protein product [Pneumocystis jirovecii]
MVVKIRLQRFGVKKHPFYHIVVSNARTARQSKPIEKLGTYDPIPQDGVKNIEINFLRTKYWIGVGAQPTDVVYKLLEKISLLPPKPHLSKKTEKEK